MLAREPDDDQRRERAAVLGGAILAVTGVASIVLAAAAPLLARGFALARQGDPEYASFVAVTAGWISLFAPQILFYGLSVHAVAVLNARGRLALAGFAPVLTNLVTILAVAGYLWSGGPRPPSLAALQAPALVVLGAGTTLGVAAMGITQWLGARRAEAGLRLRFDLRHPAIGELWRLGRWSLGYVLVNQVGLAVVLTLANSADGGVAAYQWAFAIMQLPYAVIAVSMLSAVYPRLARTADDEAAFARHVAGGIRLTAVLLVPAAVGLVLLAGPITSLLLGYGAAAGSGAAFVADALRWFGAALVPFCLYQLLTRSFYARSDTRTPMLANVGVNLVNVAAGLAAFVALDDPRARIAGLVAAYALAYLTGVGLLGWALGRRHPATLLGIGRTSTTALVASAGMSMVLVALLEVWPEPSQPAALAVRTVILAGTGSLAYLLLGLLLRSPELAQLWHRVRR
jgi:putative peptidoglycan lipid II flippase